MGKTPEFINLLPLWATWLWLIALAAVLVLHCAHLVRMGGQHRWYHSSHILMLVSQMYMFASMAFSWKWFPHGWWVNIFWLSTVAIGVFLVVRMVQRRPVSLLWLVALVMQAAMAYMWMPTWAPALTWFLVVYFSLETVAWLVGLLDDSTPSMGFGPGSHAESLPDRTPRGVAPADGASGSVVDVLERTQRMPAFVSLAHGTFSSRLSMAVMAASMAYMFAAMQLMRSAMM